MVKAMSVVVGSLMIVWLFGTEIALAFSHSGWAVLGAALIGMLVANTVAELEK